MSYTFCNDWICKSYQVILFGCNIDLTLIDEVTQHGSSKVLISLYAMYSIIWLDILKISSKSDIRFLRYGKFSLGGFLPPLFLTCGKNLVTKWELIVLKIHKCQELARYTPPMNISLKIVKSEFSLFDTPRKAVETVDGVRVLREPSEPQVPDKCGHRIRVIRDWFGASADPRVCRYVTGDCRVANVNHMSVVHRYCEGKQVCNSFQVDRRMCGSNQTNYEQVEYICVPGICDAIDYQIQHF